MQRDVVVAYSSAAIHQAAELAADAFAAVPIEETREQAEALLKSPRGDAEIVQSIGVVRSRMNGT